MKKFLPIFAALVLVFGLYGVSSAQQSSSVLTNLNFDIVGIGASPDYQAVPKESQGT